MCLPVLKPFVKTFTLCFCCLLVITAGAQVNMPVPVNDKAPSPARRFRETNRNVQFTSADNIAARASNFSATTTDAPPCTTSTFFTHIPTLPGQKISIAAIKVTPSGDYIIAGNLITNDGTSSVGVIMRIDNAGNILAQQAVNAGNINTLVLALDVLADGSIVIAGTIKNGPFNSFVGYLDRFFTIKWVHMYNAKQVVSKMSAYVTNSGKFAIAMQLPDAVTCLLLSNTGAQSWNSIITPTGFKGLISISDVPDGNIGILTNCVQGGKNVTQLTEVQSSNGQAAVSEIIGSEESYSLATSVFNAAFTTLGVIKTGQTYSLVRNILVESSKIQTHQIYNLDVPVNFTVSGAMDNAGDAIGLCLPAQEKLLFIKHFDYYQTSVEHTQAYSIPKASGMGGLARSYDGGFLFGVNTKDSSEIVLIKTDSAGTLGGCVSPVAVSNTVTETYQVPNTQVADNVLLAGVFGTVSSAVYNNISLTPQFDCRQNYCPEAPAEDTCLPTYYKTYRSHSYDDIFLSNHLMKGNKQLVETYRYDRVFGHDNLVTPGIKLFDEKGNFIKGVVMVSKNGTVTTESRQVDGSHVMLLSYSSIGNQNIYTLTLMSDNLDIIWNKSFTLPTVNGVAYNPYAYDWLKDDEGNYYFISCSPGVNLKSQGFIYKLDASGNTLWSKGYLFNGVSFVGVSATYTKSSLVLIMESSDGTSGTMRINKQGDVLNAYTYQQQYGGLMYNRTVQYTNGRILYAGNSAGQSLLLASFDSTGRPLKLKSLPSLSLPRAAAINNGKLYVVCEPLNGNTEEIILKADSALNILQVRSYPFERFRIPKGMAISSEGNIYTSGNFFIEQYGYGFIRKYDNDIKLGTCGAPYTGLAENDVAPQTSLLRVSQLAGSVTPANVPITVAADNDGPAVDNILCSSTATCNSIKIAGPPAICQVNTEYNYNIKKNAGCAATPTWLYDTAIASITKITDTSASILYKKAGTVQLKALLDGGCKIYADSLQVTVQKQPAAFTLGRDTALCPGDSLLLKAGAGFSTYAWQDGSGDSVYHVKQAGKYFVQVSNACNEKFGDTIIVASVNVPVLTIGNDTAVCLNDTLTIQANAGFASYVWAPKVNATARTAVLIPQQDVTVSVKATTAEGCHTADTINIAVKQPRTINLGSDTSFCSGDSIILNAGMGYSNYQWNDGSTSQQNVARTAGSYWVKAQDINSCYAIDTMQVLVVYPLPTVSLGNPAPLCAGSKRILDAGGFDTYLWQDGSTARYFTADTTGNYNVQVKDNNGCTGSGTTAVLDIMPLPADFLKRTDSLCQYDKLTIAATGDFSKYEWSNGATTSNIIVDMPGTYTLNVTSNTGCNGSDTITIVQKTCMPGFYVPNAFTPNGDGRNDVFRPSLFGNVQSYLFCIYNRFGELVFKTNTPGEGWDGNYKGKPFDSGTTLAWRCQYQLQGDKPVSAKGYVVLIK